MEHDPRTIVGEAANNEDLSAHRRTLYRAVASYLCWKRTKWDLEVGYGPYLKCRDVAGQVPSDKEVEGAMEAEYPGQEFEQANVMHMLEEASEAKPEVTAVFGKLEKKYPKLREVFVEPAERAEKAYEKQRDKYADVYKKIDPITERLLDDPTSTPPEDCRETLRSARETIAEREGITLDGPDAVDELRVDTPVAYQTTEAFAYCHYMNGDLDQRSPMPLPGSTYRTPSYHSMMFDDGIRFEIVGGATEASGDESGDDSDLHTTSKSGKRLPVTGSIEDHEKGKKIVFETNTETVTWQPRKCRKTDKFSHWERQGNKVVAKYQQECEPVGEAKSRKVEHQLDPLGVPADQAEMLESGMRVELLNNEMEIGDAAVLRALGWG
jgi:hypothetical protein